MKLSDIISKRLIRFNNKERQRHADMLTLAECLTIYYLGYECEANDGHITQIARRR